MMMMEKILHLLGMYTDVFKCFQLFVMTVLNSHLPRKNHICKFSFLEYVCRNEITAFVRSIYIFCVWFLSSAKCKFRTEGSYSMLSGQHTTLR